MTFADEEIWRLLNGNEHTDAGDVSYLHLWHDFDWLCRLAIDKKL